MSKKDATESKQITWHPLLFISAIVASFALSGSAWLSITIYSLLEIIVLARTESNKLKQAIFTYLFQKNETKFHTPVGELKFPNSLPNFYPIPCINSDNLQ